MSFNLNWAEHVLLTWHLGRGINPFPDKKKLLAQVERKIDIVIAY